MEDVLEVYHRQYRENEVLVCLDETSKQQVKETRLGRPPSPGSRARQVLTIMNTNATA